jgi:hypothetical protein
MTFSEAERPGLVISEGQIVILDAPNERAGRRPSAP